MLQAELISQKSFLPPNSFSNTLTEIPAQENILSGSFFEGFTEGQANVLTETGRRRPRKTVSHDLRRVSGLKTLRESPSKANENTIGGNKGAKSDRETGDLKVYFH